MGVDPAPYFRRMFNPILQQQKFDPDGDVRAPLGAGAARRARRAPRRAVEDERRGVATGGPAVGLRGVPARRLLVEGVGQLAGQVVVAGGHDGVDLVHVGRVHAHEAVGGVLRRRGSRSGDGAGELVAVVVGEGHRSGWWSSAVHPSLGRRATGSPRVAPDSCVGASFMGVATLRTGVGAGNRGLARCSPSCGARSSGRSMPWGHGSSLGADPLPAGDNTGNAR